ncbi:MAG: hypothetical protein MUF48_24630, partial [Pirellulaceae bacterium]|nr:hypothetical protein [Pirellulaceae bacterium]
MQESSRAARGELKFGVRDGYNGWAFEADRDARRAGSERFPQEDGIVRILVCRPRTAFFLVLAGLCLAIASSRAPNGLAAAGEEPAAGVPAPVEGADGAPATPAAAAPARRAAPPDTNDLNCLAADCHGPLAATPHVHGPLAVKECAACHEPKPPGHHWKPTRKQPELCTFCHESVTEKEYAHTAVEEEKCTTCHDPHGAATKALLTADSVGKLCAECHAPPKGEFVHGPAAVGDCTTCHDAHQGDDPNLIRQPGTAQCTGCHSDTAEAIASKKHPHEPATKDCTTCHAPHAAGNQDLLRKDFAELCFPCHTAMQERIAASPVKHGAVNERERCAACHAPHAADLPHLLRAPSMTLCLLCHDRELRGDGAG